MIIDPNKFQQTLNLYSLTKQLGYVVVHYTAGGTMSGAVETLTMPGGNSAHFVIGKDGDWVQLADTKKRTKHAGVSQWGKVKNLNRYSIGIELVNWGLLYKDSLGIIRNYTGNKFDGEYVYTEGNYWDAYPLKQISTLSMVLCEIIEAHPIDLYLLGHDQISPGRKTDPGPAFNWDLITKECDKHYRRV